MLTSSRGGSSGGGWGGGGSDGGGDGDGCGDGGGDGGGDSDIAHKYIQVPAVYTVAIGYHTINLEVQLICNHWTVEKHELGTCSVDLECLMDAYKSIYYSCISAHWACMQHYRILGFCSWHAQNVL